MLRSEYRTRLDMHSLGREPLASELGGRRKSTSLPVAQWFPFSLFGSLLFIWGDSSRVPSKAIPMVQKGPVLFAARSCSCSPSEIHNLVPHPVSMRLQTCCFDLLRLVFGETGGRMRLMFCVNVAGL